MQHQRSARVRACLLAALLVPVVGLAAGDVTAQVVTVSNASPHRFHGWIRTTTDTEPPASAGFCHGHPERQYRKGRQIAPDLWAIDVACRLEPGETVELNVGGMTDAVFLEPKPASDAWAHFGGWLSVNGQPMLSHVEALGDPSLPPLDDGTAAPQDGASFVTHWRARVPGTRMLVADAWLRWDNANPQVVHGELLVTCSNPAWPDLVEVAPAITLTLGDALIVPLGRAPGAPFVGAGTSFGDGQARLVPFTAIWQRHCTTAERWDTARAVASGGITAVGVERLLHQGNPRTPPGHNAHAVAAARLPESVARLYTWDGPVAGITPFSGAAGAQADQVFVGGDPLLAPAAEIVGYLNACAWGKRPCNHRERDGSPLELARHVNPRLVLWDGRAHWHRDVSPDQLGKVAVLAKEQASGWWGPDVEHFLLNGLAAAARLRDSRGLQALLRAQATVYLGQCTVAAGLSTSGPNAARAVGWESIVAVHLWRTLDDRAMAERVRERWIARFVLIAQAYGTRDVWDPRENDPRLGPGWWYHPWQQAVCAYGLQLGGDVFGVPAARDLALRGALVVLAEGFTESGGRWRAHDRVRPGGAERDTGDDTFWLFGMPMAPAVVLRHQPTNERARSIWEQMRAEAVLAKHCAWLPPEVQ
jgi:hypothetical protein